MSIRWKEETALALRAAAEGGRIALQRPARLTLRRKESVRDIVTPIDLAIESHIRDILAVSGLRVLGEETDQPCTYPFPGDSPAWIVDPIDGTANYVNALDYYAVSVGLCRGAEFLLGAVCMPSTPELFSTFGQHRSLLNGRTLEHEHRMPGASVVAASFSGTKGDPELRQREYQLFGSINDSTRGCLRLGSAASNICFTAAGRLQAAYGLRAKIWDVAGAMAIAIGAGCRAIISSRDDGPLVDYVVGSRDTVKMIHELLVGEGLMSEKCRVW